jgi:hypothetical protein
VPTCSVELLVLALLMLLVFSDAWRSPPTMKPEEDLARGVSLEGKLEREGWLRYARADEDPACR